VLSSQVLLLLLSSQKEAVLVVVVEEEEEEGILYEGGVRGITRGDKSCSKNSNTLSAANSSCGLNPSPVAMALTQAVSDRSTSPNIKTTTSYGKENLEGGEDDEHDEDDDDDGDDEENDDDDDDDEYDDDEVDEDDDGDDDDDDDDEVDDDVDDDDDGNDGDGDVHADGMGGSLSKKAVLACVCELAFKMPNALAPGTLLTSTPPSKEPSHQRWPSPHC
jgi:hypothetical protein